MTDIVEEARAMLAQETTWPWEAVDEYHAALIAAAPRLLDALADECERLSAALDAMTNQAVMASGRRATIVTDDGELERLRAENARLREAMPTDAEMESIAVIVGVGLRYTTGTIDEHHQDPAQEAFARLDAAKGVR